MIPTRSKIMRVSRAHPCPICGKPDWCTYTEDGRLAFCMRVESDRTAGNGAYVHVLRADTPALPRRPISLPRRYPDGPSAALRVNLAALCKREQDDGVDAFMLDPALMEMFGIDAWDAAKACGAYWSRSQEALAVPMRDASGAVVGVRYRDLVTGRKWSALGGHDGLFLPDNLKPEAGEIWCAEGLTDTIALNALNIPAVGRSSCNTGAALIASLCQLLRVSKLTIVADSDGNKEARDRLFQPGLDGARHLAERIGVRYRIVFPPRRTKDVRGYLLASASYGAEMVARMVRSWARDAKWSFPLPRRAASTPPIGTFTASNA